MTKHMKIGLEFQFTTSQGGRPSISQWLSYWRFISIHDLTRRSTLPRRSHLHHYFISIHDLTRRSTRTRFCHFGFSMSFQFTTSQGGRLKLTQASQPSETFQFTTSQGGRPLIYGFWVFRWYFNSRPHKEVDTDVFNQHVFEQYFNSRPHKEVDPKCWGNRTKSDISIHDLTRRSTSLRVFFESPTSFQFTTSQGGRLGCSANRLTIDIISIHDLTRRSTFLCSVARF